MRISDWSSDVCSSDLGLLTNRYLDGVPAGSRASEGRWISEDNIDDAYLERARALNAIAEARGQSLAQLALLWVLRHQIGRASCRERCVSTCRSRGTPYH